jgi:hypothetical protein
VSPRSGDCSRVLTRFRWVKPAPTRPTRRHFGHTRHNRHGRPTSQKEAAANVAELLAPGKKTVSFCQCRFHIEAAEDNEAGASTPPRAHRAHCDEPRRAMSRPVDN